MDGRGRPVAEVAQEVREGDKAGGDDGVIRPKVPPHSREAVDL